MRLVSGDSERVEIRFFDSNGRDITEASQRTIERLLAGEEFRHAFAGDIGDIVFPPRALSSTRPRWRTPSTPNSSGSVASRWCSTTRSGRRRSPSRRCSPRSTPTCSRSTLRAATRRPCSASTSGSADRRVATLVRSSGSDLGLLLDPSGETAAWSTAAASGARRRPGPRRAAHDAGRRRSRRRRVALPGVGDPGGRAASSWTVVASWSARRRRRTSVMEAASRRDISRR